MQRLFATYLEQDNRTQRYRLPLKQTLRTIVDAAEPLLRGVPVDTTDLPDGLLPAATLAEWTAIFQNVLLNAVNAIAAGENRGQVRVYARLDLRLHYVRVDDTGVGVDLEHGDRYFRPFERGLPRKLASDSTLGGSGLGLTIVRIVADRIGCRARFVEPPDGYSTSFDLSWDEDE